MIYLLAGNAAQAANYCREHGLSLRDAMYVSTPAHLAGLKEPSYAVVGTFWDHIRAIDIWKSLLVTFAGSPKPLPVAPPEIQKFIQPNVPTLITGPMPVMTSCDISSCGVVIGSNAGFVSLPGDSELEPIEEDEPVVEKKKKKIGFKSIRK